MFAVALTRAGRLVLDSLAAPLPRLRDDQARRGSWATWPLARWPGVWAGDVWPPRDRSQPSSSAECQSRRQAGFAGSDGNLLRRPQVAISLCDARFRRAALMICCSTSRPPDHNDLVAALESVATVGS